MDVVNNREYKNIRKLSVERRASPFPVKKLAPGNSSVIIAQLLVITSNLLTLSIDQKELNY